MNSLRQTKLTGNQLTTGLVGEIMTAALERGEGGEVVGTLY